MLGNASLFPRLARQDPGGSRCWHEQSAGSTHLRCGTRDHPTVWTAAARYRDARSTTSPRSSSHHPSSATGGALDPTGRASHGNPSRALRSLGGADRRSGEYHHHEPCHPTAGVDPKKRTVGAAERNAKHRAIWHRIVTKLDARRYVFIDESGANITLVPRYGRAPRGERCPGIVPIGHKLR